MKGTAMQLLPLHRALCAVHHVLWGAAGDHAHHMLQHVLVWHAALVSVREDGVEDGG